MTELRDAFFYALLKKAKNDKNVILLTADMGAFALKEFVEQMPNQFFNVGIAEQNMISVAAGLAQEGKQIYCYSISSFLLFRTLEQIKIDVCNMKSNIILVGVGGGVDYSYDGSTHHCVQDIGILRTLPNISICCPYDVETVENSVNKIGPLYIRLPKGNSDTLPKMRFPKFYVIRIGSSYILTYGMLVYKVLEILNKLNRLDIGVIAVETLKPLDSSEFNEVVDFSRHLMVIEPHSEVGGLSTILKEMKTQKDISYYAFKDEFCDIGGSLNYIYNNYGIDFEKIEKELKGWTNE